MFNQSKLLDEIYDSGSETELDDSDKENQPAGSAVMRDITQYRVCGWVGRYR